MTNFTKEDLENLRLCVAKYRNGHDEVVLPELFEKVQDAIDAHMELKQIDGFVNNPTDYTDCNHDWHELELRSPATPTIICVKCRALHFIREEK